MSSPVGRIGGSMSNKDGRSEYIQGLRELADFLEGTPAYPLPLSFLGWHLTTDREQFLGLVRLLRAGAKKKLGGDFHVVRSFGPHVLSPYIAEDKVCEPHVTGKRMVTEKVPTAFEERTWEEDVVEWTCPESLLEQKG